MEVIADANRCLMNTGQALHPTEQWARDMQSLREAARLALAKRSRDK